VIRVVTTLLAGLPETISGVVTSFVPGPIRQDGEPIRPQSLERDHSRHARFVPAPCVSSSHRCPTVEC
jgi:hypothetical protein